MQVTRYTKFFGCLAFAVILSEAHPAAASFRSTSAAACKSFDQFSMGTTVWATDGIQFYNPSPSAQDMAMCPVVSDNNFTSSVSAHASSVAVTVFGYKNSAVAYSGHPFGPWCQGVVGNGSYMALRACRTYSSGTGGSCGAANLPSAGNFAAALNVSTWTPGTDSDGYYIYAYVGCQFPYAAQVPNALIGYKITN